MAKSSVVLVTGASSGIGRATALRFANKGFQTFATSRRPQPQGPDGITWLVMDVSDDASVAQAMHDLMQRAGRLDILVNNAGYGLFGAVEETSLEEAKRQLEVNFWGAVRVTNHVLPGMRERRSGRIVNISSVLGFLAVPYHAYYVASKHALEGYTEALALELAPFGIAAVLVEPSFTNSSFFAHRQEAQQHNPAYAAERTRVLATMGERLADGSAPETIAHVVYKAATASSPPGRSTAGSRAGMLKFGRALLSTNAFDAMVRRKFSPKA